jgi:hypothetical protein
MAVEIFSKITFENALPKHKDTGEKLCREAGLIQGEYCYWLNFGSPHAEILIRSSVAPDGFSRDTGKDSIRCWIVSPGETKPLAKKLNCYTTRVKGWETRLVNVLRKLVPIAWKIKPCPKCGISMRVVEIKNGSNAGKGALTCPAMENGKFCNHHFEVLPEAPQD